MAKLEGKVAIVTGASRGIGLATARALVDAGARVVIASTTEGGAGDAARALGPAAIGVRADVRVDEDVEALFAAAVSAFGGIDILINNAGVGIFDRVERLSVAQFEQIIDTNLTGAFRCTRLALPLFKARGGGWIINISSLAGRNPFPGGAVYCASKAALNAFTDALMQEVRQDGIRVSSVAPGSVRTEFMTRSHDATHAPATDDGWKLTPEDVAQAVLDLLGHPGRSLPSLVEIRPARTRA